MKNIRLLAIALLDTDNGIADDAFAILAPELAATGNQDILDKVESKKGRNWLGEDDAEQLRKVGEPANCCELGNCLCGEAH
jgi:hypothetical protein